MQAPGEAPNNAPFEKAWGVDTRGGRIGAQAGLAVPTGVNVQGGQPVELQFVQRDTGNGTMNTMMPSTPLLDKNAFGYNPADLAAHQARLVQLENERQQLAKQAPIQFGSPQLRAALQAAALGQGPSAAAALGAQAQNEAFRNQLSQMGGHAGNPLSGLQAQLAAQHNLSGMGMNIASQAASQAQQDQARGAQAYWAGQTHQAQLAGAQRALSAQGQMGYLDALEQARQYQRMQQQNYQSKQAALEMENRLAMARSEQAQSQANAQLSGHILGGAVSTGTTLASGGSK